MSSIDQIIDELMAVDSELSTYMNHIQREQDELTNTMSKVQNTFGNQHAGQSIVSTLYKTLQNIVVADGSLNCVKQGINRYMQELQK